MSGGFASHRKTRRSNERLLFIRFCRLLLWNSVAEDLWTQNLKSRMFDNNIRAPQRRATSLDDAVFRTQNVESENLWRQNVNVIKTRLK